MKVRMVIIGLVLAVALAFGSGAFSHFVYPGPSETVRQVTVEVAPTVDRCDRFWQLFADAQSDAAVSMLRRFHPDRDCLTIAAPPPTAWGTPFHLPSLPPLPELPPLNP
jgi:hypothetical protein